MRKLLSLLVILSLLMATWLTWVTFIPHTPASMPLVVDVPAGQSLSQTAEQFAQQDAIKSAWAFQIVARLTGLDTRIKAGDYRLVKATSMWELFTRLEKGEAGEYTITAFEGWTFRQFRQALAKHPALKHDTAALSDRELLQKLGSEHDHPEGLFFPDTYFFLKGTSEFALLKRAYDKMQQELQRAWEVRQPNLPYKTPYELLKMASIIEKETGHEEDRAHVAAVFVNRLNIGMRLQTDPSVIYGVGAAYNGKITKRHLLTDTPYNTYTRAGLTPTPIALPGRAALEAAANPAPSRALYFVARGDGTSQFSETLDEHNAAVRKYILGKGD